MNDIEIFVRLGLALFLGALIGLERVRMGKQIGIRTFGLVALGAALFVIISEYTVLYLHPEADPLRVLSNVVTGIGFIGAGMIIFKQDQITNLTTATGVWLSAAIGSAVGFGMYTVAIGVTLLTILTFTLLLDFEIYLKKKMLKKEEIQNSLEE